MIVHGPNRQSQTTAVQPDIHFFSSFLLLNRGAKALSMPATTKKRTREKKSKHKKLSWLSQQRGGFRKIKKGKKKCPL